MDSYPKYMKYDDPGHGWLKVPASELAALGIVTKISNCSYIKDGDVFLEEDCDLAVFVKAKGWTQDDYARNVGWSDGEQNSQIRKYEFYTLAGVARAIDKCKRKQAA